MCNVKTIIASHWNLMYIIYYTVLQKNQNSARELRGVMFSVGIYDSDRTKYW